MADAQHPEVRKIDARSLRGLAHPLRMQLLDALRFGGPATASQLAEKLGESSGATSYHLRQLAEYGFIEDDPGQGKGRERWWKATHTGLEFDDELLTDADPAVRGAADLYMHEVATSHTRDLATWLGNRDSWPEEWNLAWDMSSTTLRLTPEQTLEFIQDVHRVYEKYRSRAVPEGTPGTQQIRAHSHVFPITTT
ncbi:MULTISPECIES: transcriptional regulator [unclassified Streptomyces]|uniref:ArsR/SmtB family transcription factor n=1 Tax=unclassified Streptomyces TaxID=2593676 RepID=UPI000DDA4B78|nr:MULTISPECIES: helix-turn-helix domain-containing protein [unclassified Streptomyces]QZZ28085.1 helix-turn-helix transcriptional regulator [Streptomyces sp. ST1015]